MRWLLIVYACKQHDLWKVKPLETWSSSFRMRFCFAVLSHRRRHASHRFCQAAFVQVKGFESNSIFWRWMGNPPTEFHGRIETRKNLLFDGLRNTALTICGLVTALECILNSTAMALIRTRTIGIPRNWKIIDGPLSNDPAFHFPRTI